MIVEAALAIEHAHAYGVIHRDIKPGNLIRDRVGKIWVTDFGLAQVESDPTQLTRTGDPMGTLRYMSPEQASGNRVTLDHRTDIYSLGATLYELLVLQPAFQSDNYRKLLNEVAEKEPAPPETVDPHLPIELDTIVRKAMSKSSFERYETAQALADDLQRWLDDKPIAARPPTLLERANKWRRRNSWLVAAASVLLLVTTISLSVTTAIVWRQQSITASALTAEKQERRRAEANFAQARAVVDTFSELSERELAYRPDLQELRRQFLETSLGFYQELLAQRSSDSELSKQVRQTADQVEKMVEELRVLDNVQPLMFLTDARIRGELELSQQSGATLIGTIERFRLEREAMANQHVGGLVSENASLSVLLREFDQQISENLNEDQLKRLRQIYRQSWLPFTFKSREIVEQLGLTRDQRLEINRIIEETRPNRSRHGFDREPGAPIFANPGGRPMGRGPEEFGRRPGRPPVSRGPKGPPPGTEITLAEIEKILTEEQLQRWNLLIGDPFQF